MTYGFKVKFSGDGEAEVFDTYGEPPVEGNIDVYGHSTKYGVSIGVSLVNEDKIILVGATGQAPAVI